MFNEDLPRLTARIPTHDKTIKKAFEMFSVLNNFCSEVRNKLKSQFYLFDIDDRCVYFGSLLSYLYPFSSLP